MFDELIKRCIENDGYVGLIVVKYNRNKNIFYDKFKNLDCRIDKYDNRIQFNNGSYILY